MLRDKRTPLLLLVAGLSLSFLMDMSPARLPGLILTALAGVVIILPRKRWQRVVGIVLCCLLAFFSLSGMVKEMMVERFTTEAAHDWPAPQGLVKLGGQKITYTIGNNWYSAIACYWSDDNFCLVAGHPMKDLPKGSDRTAVQIISQGRIEDVEAEFLFNEDCGLGLQLPADFLLDAPDYAIASTGQVEAGAEAEIISIQGGSIMVEVVGFLDTRYREEIIVKALDPNQKLIKGMSGSPLVQKGAIIGFLRGGLTGMKDYGACSPAAKVYQEAQGHLKTDKKEGYSRGGSEGKKRASTGSWLSFPPAWANLCWASSSSFFTWRK